MIYYILLHIFTVSDKHTQHESTKSLTPYRDKNDLQVLTKYSTNGRKDMLINDSKSVQSSIYIGVYKYFAPVWNRFLLVPKKLNDKNWKMVREYAFIGITAILVTIYCVLNLMYK